MKTLASHTRSSPNLSKWARAYVLAVEEEIKSHRTNVWTVQWGSSVRGKILFASCAPDEVTMVKTFISMLKLEWKCDWNKYRFTCCIVNFDKELFNQTWKLVKEYKWYRNKKLKKHLTGVANDIIKHDSRQYTLDASARESLGMVMQVMRESGFRSYSYAPKKMVFAQADMAVVIVFRWDWSNAKNYWQSMLDRMNSKQKYQFLGWMMKYNTLYKTTLRSMEKETMIKKKGNWTDLIRVVIKSMNANDHLTVAIKEHKLKLLELIIDETENSLDWLIDIFVKEFGSKDQRYAALLIGDFIAVKATTPGNVATQKYIDFVEQTLDLKWHRIAQK